MLTTAVRGLCPLLGDTRTQAWEQARHDSESRHLLAKMPLGLLLVFSSVSTAVNDVGSEAFGRRRVLVAAASTATSLVVSRAKAAPAVIQSTREKAVNSLLSRVPAYVVTNAAGEPYLTESDEQGRRYGSVFLGPKDAAKVLGQVRQFDPAASLAVVPLSTLYSDVARTEADGAIARDTVQQPRDSTSKDLRLFVLRSLSDESTEAVSMLPGATMLPGVSLFYEPSLFLGSESAQQRPYFFRLADLNTVWRRANGDDRNEGRVSPSLRVINLEVLLGQVAEGQAGVAPILVRARDLIVCLGTRYPHVSERPHLRSPDGSLTQMPPSETAELEYVASS